MLPFNSLPDTQELQLDSQVQKKEKKKKKASPIPVKTTTYPIYRLEINLQFPLLREYR